MEETGGAERPTPRRSRLMGLLTPRLKNVSGIVASLAALGAVASGLLGYWQVWKTVKSDFLQEHASRVALGTATISPRPTLVVMPFANATGDPSQAGVAAELTQELSIALGRFGAQRLLGFAAMSVGGAPSNPIEAARSVGGDYVVEGTLRGRPGSLRGTVRLQYARTGEQVWSYAFEPLHDTFGSLSAQEEVAARLSVLIGSYQGAITRAEYQRNQGKPANELTSYECIVEGAMAASYQTSEHVLRARTCLLALTEKEPTNSTAWAMLAGVYNAQRLLGIGLIGEEATDFDKRAYLSQKIFEAGLKASELDPGDSYARFRLAHGYYAVCQPELLHAEAKKAVALNPHDIQALGILGLDLAFSGYYDEGSAMAQKALSLLTPNAPVLWWYGPATRHLAREEYQEALEDYRRAYVEQFWLTYMYQAAALNLTGHIEEAKMQLPKLRAKLPGANLRKIDAFLKMLWFDRAFREKLGATLRQVGLEE